MARGTEVTITERDLLGRRPLVPRFLSHVQQRRCGNSCELWISPFDSGGAPRFYLRRPQPQVSPQRVAFALAYRITVPAGRKLIATCGNAKCVRADHLRFATPAPPRKPRGIMLNPEKAAAMREERAAGKTLRDIGEHFHVSESMACLVVNGKRWRQL